MTTTMMNYRISIPQQVEHKCFTINYNEFVVLQCSVIIRYMFCRSYTLLISFPRSTPS